MLIQTNKHKKCTERKEKKKKQTKNRERKKEKIIILKYIFEIISKIPVDKKKSVIEM